MITFKEYSKVLLEFFDTVEGAVKHIDHLEENIINSCLLYTSPSPRD